MQSLDIYGSGSGPASSNPERRRCRRHRVRVPLYARLGAASATINLHEVIDICEGGVCIQTSEKLLNDSTLNLSLDHSANLPPILLPAKVAWSNSFGRAGIRFWEISPPALHELRTLLRENALAEEESAAAELNIETPPEGHDSFASKNEDVALSNSLSDSDFTSILSALGAVKKEAEGFGADINRILELIASRMISFTGGTGAAIAISHDGEFICRATAGNDAPPAGTRVESESGFSGECIRSGEILYCEDTESDLRVNREHCRGLGVRSIIAAPARLNDCVVGLMEVFSSSPRAFNPHAILIVQYLSGTISEALGRVRGTALVEEQSAPEEQEDHAGPVASSSWLRSGVLTAAILTVGLAFAWLLVPHASWKIPPQKSVGKIQSSASPSPSLNSAASGNSLDEQRKLAEQGDPTEQFAVGVHYAAGDGVPQDYTQAVHWFLLAADQGHVEAQGTLGAYYWAGRGVPQDLAKAYFWSLLAQAGGDKASQYRVPILASRLTHEQILTAQQQANNWLKDHEAHSASSTSD
jgi:GAF domain-containing protein